MTRLRPGIALALVVLVLAAAALVTLARVTQPADPTPVPSYPYVVRTLEGATLTVMPEDLDRAERCLAQAMTPCPPP